MNEPGDPPDEIFDGNAAAGALREVFAVELTAAMAQCDGCGRRAPLAEAQLFLHAPGLVGRCPGCQAVLLRVVTAPDRTWLDFRGVRSMEIRTG